MGHRVAIVGGTGFDAAGTGQELDLETTYGSVALSHQRLLGHDVFFLPRHGRDHAVPPHRLNARAHMRALEAARVDYVIAVLNVGAVRPGLPAASWMIPNDLIDLTGGRPRSFHDDRAVHVDPNEPFCPHVRSALLKTSEPGVIQDGVYACVDGPQLETAAGVATLRAMGADVVGMTAAPEAWLAREAGLCYGAVAFVANAAGAGESKGGTARRIRDSMARRAPSLRKWILRSLKRLPDRKTCACRARSRSADIGLPARGNR